MRFQWVTPLSDDLWRGVGIGARSSLLTPLYVERFSGRLTGKWTSRHGEGHDYWEMTVIGSGSGVLKGDIPVELSPGTVCLLPPRTGHVEYAPESMELFWIGLDGGYMRKIPSAGPITSRPEGAQSLAMELWNLTRKPRQAVGPELDGLALVLLNRFLRASATPEEPAARRIEQALAFLQTNFAEEIAIPELALRFGYSEGHFYREFKRLTGHTPVSYLTTQRIEEAKRCLIYSDLSVAEISDRVGYSTVQYFTRSFRAATGTTPAAFRRQARERQ